jgi:hypothetical protein
MLATIGSFRDLGAIPAGGGASLCAIADRRDK